MKKLIISIIITACLPLAGFCQWNYHYYFDVGTNSEYYTCKFGGAMFTGIDTGYYCASAHFHPPTPHSENEVSLLKTTNDCNSWKRIFWDGNYGSRYIYELRFFKPYLFLIGNATIYTYIIGEYDNNIYDLLYFEGYYKDFYAHDITNYKVLFDDHSFQRILSYYENTIEIKRDTFNTYKPWKIVYPIDTAGILLSIPDTSTDDKGVITKYTPSQGYHIVYQSKSHGLTDMHFPSTNTGYVSCNDGTVLSTDDLGSTWKVLNTGYTLKLNSIFFTNDSTGYAVGSSGLILKTKDYGLTWIRYPFAFNVNITKVFFVTDSVGFFLTGQILFKTTNGGELWINESITKNTCIDIFPNPNNGFFTLQIFELIQGVADIKIINIAGQEVWSNRIHIAEQQINIDVSFLPNGVYYLRLTSENKSFISKFVIAK